uniref:Uncharacterized protein n=1 Tax=Arundo donax TaxID=35708 RepID=A0A0A9DR19_ARUDO
MFKYSNFRKGGGAIPCLLSTITKH